MNKKELLLLSNVEKLLFKYKLNLNDLKNNLKINYIRGSWKGWQKKNKTSSTVQLIDCFNYQEYLPNLNKNNYKWPIVIKMDIWRSQISNYNYAIEEWLKTLKQMFFVSKTRTINKEKELERKKKLSLIYKDKKQLQKYKNK